MEWFESIRRIRALKLELARIDPRGGMPVAPPPGASEQAIAGVERRMGFPLPPSYRALLALYDGWPQLFAGAGLLGVRALSRGTFVDVARMVIEDRGATAPLIPFGIDVNAEVVFAWDTALARPDGEMEVVLWINDIGMRAASFPAMLEVLVEMLSSELHDRRRIGVVSEAPQSQVRPVAASASARLTAPRPVARIAAFG